MADKKTRPEIKAGEIIRKQVVQVPEKATEERSFTFAVSDASVDRYGDTIALEGWDLAKFRANPVILFGHNQDAFPVGKSLREYSEGGKLKSAIQFTSQEENPDGYRCMLLVQNGYLNATSVGFLPREFEVNEERTGDDWFPKVDFKAQELLEISIVPVPANPNALLEAKSAGLEIDFVADWAERALKACRGEGVWIQKGALGILRALEPSKIYSIPAAPEVKAAPPEPSEEEIRAATREAMQAGLTKALADLRMKTTGKID
jgi:HK97 family phage prohead protease